MLGWDTSRAFPKFESYHVVVVVVGWVELFAKPINRACLW